MINQRIEEGPISDFANKAMLNHPRTTRIAGHVADFISGSAGGPEMFHQYAKATVPDEHIKATPLHPKLNAAHDKLKAFQNTVHGKIASTMGTKFGKQITANSMKRAPA